MESERSDVLGELARAVIEMDSALARESAAAAIKAGLDPYKAIIDGLSLWIR